jgi:hypothetical protein
MHEFEALWIGGSDAESEGTWYWIETGKNIDYNLAWLPNEPNDMQGTQNCITLTKARYGTGFWDRACHKEEHFLCQTAEN